MKKNVYMKKGENILQGLKERNISFYAPCSGKGICGKCKVKIKNSTSNITEEEIKHLSKKEIEEGIRLACKTYMSEDGEVEIDYDINGCKNDLKKIKYNTKSFIQQKYIKIDLENGVSVIDIIKKQLNNVYIDNEMMRNISNINYNEGINITLYKDRIIDIKNDNYFNEKYGIAIDIGTTTVAVYLLNLNTGEQISVKSFQNPQAVYGSDVISRINYTIENKKGIDVLRQKIIKEIDYNIGLILDQFNIDRQEVYKCVIVGNTTMSHLFWGLNLNTLSKIPFIPINREMLYDRACNIAFDNMNKNAVVIFLPNIAGFLGSDTVAAMIEADFINNDKNILLIDLGTNGEIVLFTKKSILACSTAAGPAFEGANIKFGMQAFDGAINKLNIKEDIEYETINNKKARGICGSALVDIVSEMKKSGIINKTGKINNPEKIKNDKLRNRVLKKDKKYEFKITENISITQDDIRQLQLAKSAIRSGINILMEKQKISIQDLDYIYLAGAFGNFINKESAKGIGLIPNVDSDNIISLGNAAGEGAKKFLCNDNLEEDINYYMNNTEHVDIAKYENFQEEFLKNIYL
ncbi:ASKHA domain-containing protein [Tepidibacter hydrothermalis]|uniref:ASKHA domain-containing protein n=1 Tax=Tepidibacter hydrothermalis TaxID=3036126 RepID=A0ABY8EGL4_9FIRM|nr:ASKHA domain-containing protein [Tepidibacter hydrothermalis]WFD09913.1 ASKHA domain-containing protein [Tepidibacter hydrothermalis]